MVNLVATMQEFNQVRPMEFNPETHNLQEFNPAKNIQFNSMKGIQEFNTSINVQEFNATKMQEFHSTKLPHIKEVMRVSRNNVCIWWIFSGRIWT